ncbi:MAG TPA: glycosyl transferase, partial [Telluria sp.]|nr:glycosyl transferase [Telluria sp.]
PFGRLFLGDGGAYLLGFLTAWLAVMLSYRNPDVSVWAPLLACAYPVFETLFSIVRRLGNGTHPFEPDDRHLHSLIKVGLVLRLFPRLRADLRNALVSPFAWAIAAGPALLAVRFATDTGALLLACVAGLALYLAAWRCAAAASAPRARYIAPVVALNEAAGEEPQRVRRAS